MKRDGVNRMIPLAKRDSELDIQDMSQKIINQGVLTRFEATSMSIKHPKVVAARAARAIGAHETPFNLLTYLLLNFLEITHVKL